MRLVLFWLTTANGPPELEVPRSLEDRNPIWAPAGIRPLCFYGGEDGRDRALALAYDSTEQRVCEADGLDSVQERDGENSMGQMDEWGLMEQMDE